jgi:hypothetical protein
MRRLSLDRWHLDVAPNAIDHLTPGMLQVRGYGLPRVHDIAGPQSIHDGIVLLLVLAPEGHGKRLPNELTPRRMLLRLQYQSEDGNQEIIVGCRGDGLVQHSIPMAKFVQCASRRRRCVARFDVVQIRRGGIDHDQLGKLRLDGESRLHDLSGTGVLQAGHARTGALFRDVRTATAPPFDVAFHLQREQRIAHGRAWQPKASGQLSFRRQSGAALNRAIGKTRAYEMANFGECRRHLTG